MKNVTFEDAIEMLGDHKELLWERASKMEAEYNRNDVCKYNWDRDIKPVYAMAAAFESSIRFLRERSEFKHDKIL